jgi:hypothetical protein
MLTDDDKNILKDMIGKHLNTLLSQTVHFCLINDAFSIHETMTLKINESYFLFDSVELEIEENGYINYVHKVSMKKSIIPETMPYVYTENKSIQFTKQISSISVWSNIIKISLYQQSVKLETTAIRFIGGILIELENGTTMILKPTDPGGFKVIFNKNNTHMHVNDLTLIEVFNH